jgi:hypothetical protein
MQSVETFVGGARPALPFGGHATSGIQGKVFKMRDEIDGRMWVAHHESFSQWVDGAAAALRNGLHRLAGWDGSVHQLLALVAAFALTALDLGFAGGAA